MHGRINKHTLKTWNECLVSLKNLIKIKYMGWASQWIRIVLNHGSLMNSSKKLGVDK